MFSATQSIKTRAELSISTSRSLDILHRPLDTQPQGLRRAFSRIHTRTGRTLAATQPPALSSSRSGSRPSPVISSPRQLTAYHREQPRPALSSAHYVHRRRKFGGICKGINSISQRIVCAIMRMTTRQERGTKRKASRKPLRKAKTSIGATGIFFNQHRSYKNKIRRSRKLAAEARSGVGKDTERSLSSTPTTAQPNVINRGLSVSVNVPGTSAGAPSARRKIKRVPAPRWSTAYAEIYGVRESQDVSKHASGSGAECPPVAL